ncbi:hypothetical protein HDU67_003737 [Dinochytrium kinnereticum]|nr:hypothetical protein HDU67_003737 [Dinochytrium kinnereticum]
MASPYIMPFQRTPSQSRRAHASDPQQCMPLPFPSSNDHPHVIGVAQVTMTRSSSQNTSSTPSWITSFAAKAKRMSSKSDDAVCATNSSTATTAKVGRRVGQPLIPLSIPMKSNGSPRRVVGSLHSPTSWSHAFPAQPEVKAFVAQTEVDMPAIQKLTLNDPASALCLDNDNLQTPTQESIGAFSDRLTARQFANLTNMDIHVWEDEEEEMSGPSPLEASSTTSMDYSDSESSCGDVPPSYPSTCSNSTISSATSSISSTSSNKSGPRLDMSLFTSPASPMAIPSATSMHRLVIPTDSNTLHRRVSADVAMHSPASKPFIPSHVRTPSAPNLSPASPNPYAQSPTVLSPALLPLLANWKPLQPSSSSPPLGISNNPIPSSPSSWSSESPIRRSSLSAIRSNPDISNRFRLSNSPSLSSLSSSLSDQDYPAYSPQTPCTTGSLDRCTTVTKKGRFTVTKEPSSYYYSHVRRVSVSVEGMKEEEEEKVVAAALAKPIGSRFVVQVAESPVGVKPPSVGSESGDSGVEIA